VSAVTPLANGDARAEYRAARDAVGLVDRSDLGVVEVAGRDRAKFLHALLSNDVAALATGQGCAAALLDVHGKVQVTLVAGTRDEYITPKVLAGIERRLSEQAIPLRKQVFDGGHEIEPAALRQLAER